MTDKTISPKNPELKSETDAKGESKTIARKTQWRGWRRKMARLNLSGGGRWG